MIAGRNRYSMFVGLLATGSKVKNIVRDMGRGKGERGGGGKF